MRSLTAAYSTKQCSVDIGTGSYHYRDVLKLCLPSTRRPRCWHAVHTSTPCMHSSATLLPLQQCICSALSPPDSSRASLLPPQFQVLCTAAHRRTTSSRRHAAAEYPARARAPASAGSSRHLEPWLPSLPILPEESRPLTATKCCDRQVAHGHQPRHLVEIGRASCRERV